MTDVGTGDVAVVVDAPVQVPPEWFQSRLYLLEEFEGEVAKVGLTPLLGVLKELGRLYCNYQQEYTPHGMHQTADRFQRLCREHNLVCPLVQHDPPPRDDGAIFADACKTQ